MRGIGFMRRPLGIEYAGARYHVMNRGDRRETILHDDADWQEFLGSLGQSCFKTGDPKSRLTSCSVFRKIAFAEAEIDCALQSNSR